MGATTCSMRFARSIDADEINRIVSSDPRWELARKLGLDKMSLRIDPLSQDIGEIHTEWKSVEGVAEFLSQSPEPFTFKIGNQVVAEPTASPKVVVDPSNLESALRILGRP